MEADRMAPRDGYAAIGSYAAIGDGRTVALIAGDGSIDWLCLPELDSPSVFGALLDPERGGSFRLAPEQGHTAERRYLPDTNVLETTFTTATGAVRVTDAMPLPLAGLAPDRELVRSVEGIAGSVALSWSVEPRFGYADGETRLGTRAGRPVATAGSEGLAVNCWGAGEPRISAGAVRGRFVAEAGGTSLISLGVAHATPLVLPSRREVEERLARTIAFWRHWAEERRYGGPWRQAVVRSALALKLLIYAPSGAIAAAATTSLPEDVGGVRNWDYRYSWIRDSSATLDALLRLGCPAEAEAFFSWLMHASQLTHPKLRILYRLNGTPRSPERELALAGYRGSRPVRIGNAAGSQEQLDVYGHLLQTAWLYCRAGGRLDRDAAGRLAATADLICELWRRKDSGIWEVRNAPAHFTESKMMCWIGLERAGGLAEEGRVPDEGAGRWRRAAEEIRGFVNERCWSEELQAYTRFPGSGETDAGLLLPSLLGYDDGAGGARLLSTARLIQDKLSRGPLLFRYRGEDGLPGAEGAFLACSFWLVDALARLGERGEAEELMDRMVGLANDVGLYSEEMDPDDGEFLGNLPQGLVHLALINAAATLEEAART
ncbi:MAG TPA: glycoside hydrolase family 15 protein [Solirubrobacterales bacterium]|nr:glycoside hydrolase family 15 protein [Solirubrobacterales bacterium]